MAIAAGRELREELWRRSLARLAPKMDAERVVRALLPRPGAVVVAVAAICAMLPGLGVAVFLTQLAENAEPATRVAGSLGFFGVFGTAPAAFLLVVAALLAGRPGARAVLLGAAVVLLLVGGVSCGASMMMGEEPIEGGAPTAARGALFVFGPPLLLVLLPALGFAVWTPVRLERDLVAEQRRRLHEVLLERGSVAIDDLLLASGLGERGVRRHLPELEASGALALRIDDDNRRVFTTRRVASRQALLVDLVETRAQLGLGELAEEVGEPLAVVEGWVHELLEAGALSARLDTGELTFDPDGAGAALLRTCASCGGPMQAVGRGLFHCTYCDAEEYG